MKKKISLLLCFFTGLMAVAQQGHKQLSGKEDESLAALNSLAIKPHQSIDLAEYKRQYAVNKELWVKAFDYLRSHDLASLPVGRTKLAGDSLTVSVTNAPDKAFDSTKWESHQKFIDIQYIISGKEKMGVAKASQAKIVKAYDAARDVANYETEGVFYVADPSQFFIFFPQDAHRPSIKVDEGEVKKIVIKVLAANQPAG